MLILLRQGKISKWFSGIGQEAISVGVASVLEEDEYILPMHRNLGILRVGTFLCIGYSHNGKGKANGFTKGRDRSFLGTQSVPLWGISAGPNLGVAD